MEIKRSEWTLDHMFMNGGCGDLLGNGGYPITNQGGLAEEYSVERTHGHYRIPQLAEEAG